jgi:hypothetical protein
MNALVKPIVDNLKSVEKTLNQAEHKYESIMYLSHERNIADKSTDIKIEELLHLHSQGNIQITLSDDTVYISRFTVQNCKYNSILKDQINNEEVFIDLDSSLFEIFMDIIRNSQAETDYSCQLERIKPDCKKINFNTNIKPFGKMLERETFINHMKNFFYKDWETILDQFNFKLSKSSVKKVVKPANLPK